MFIEVLCKTKVEEIREMNLDSYILSMRCKDNVGFIIIYYFLTRSEKDIQISQIVKLKINSQAK